MAGLRLRVLPWLRPDDERARAAMVAVMLALMWRYMIWRWAGRCRPFGLTLEWIVGLIFVDQSRP